MVQQEPEETYLLLTHKRELSRYDRNEFEIRTGQFCRGSYDYCLSMRYQCMYCS